MTALWIILGIVVFVAAVLSFSLTIYVSITDHVEMKAGIFGYRKTVFPMEEESPEEERREPEKAKKKKRRKKKSADLEKKKKELGENPPDKKTFGETLELIVTMVKSILPGTAKLLSHLRITQLRLYMTVAEDEADRTAIEYGAVSAGIYNLLAILDQAFTLKVKAVDVVPDFVTGEAVYDISFRVKLRLGNILGAGIGIFFKILVNTIKGRMGQAQEPPSGKTRENSKNNNKAVHSA